MKAATVGGARRWLFPALVMALLWVWLYAPSPALAHAKLLKSSPTAGALLDAPPEKVELSFSEGVSLQFSSMKLLDRSRKELAMGALGHEGQGDTYVAASLPSGLAPGTYTVVWRVLSAVDGHVTTGNLAFRVRPPAGSQGTTEPGGSAEAPPEEVVPVSPVEGSTETPDPFRWLTRSLLLASAALLVGGAIFSALVVRPTLANDPGGPALLPVLRRGLGRAGTIAAAVLLLALALDLVLQIGSIVGGGLGVGLQNLALAGTLITSTGYGYAWIVKVAAGAALLAVMLVAWRAGQPSEGKAPLPVWSIATLAGVGLALGEALSSHAAASGSGSSAASGGTLVSGGVIPLPLLSDWVHLTTAFTWAGGLGYMALVLYPAFRSSGLSSEEQRAVLGRAVPRFSRVALLSVAILAVTGTYNALVHTTDLGAFATSAYGQVLILKIALFAFLMPLGAINLLKLTPLLRRKEQTGSPGSPTGRTTGVDPTRSLRRTVRGEVVLVVGALVCAAGLSLLPPPSDAEGAYTASPNATTVAAAPTTPVTQPTPTEPVPLTASAQTGVQGYRVALDVTSSFEGDELTATVGRADPAAVPLTDVRKVIFKVTPQDVDGGSTALEAEAEAGGGGDNQVWKANETVLTLDGGYMVTVIVQRTQAPDLKAAFRLDLSLDTGLKARASEVLEIRLDTVPSPPISGTATLKLMLLDGTGVPVSDATITVSPLMPAHGHIEPTDVAKAVPGEPGAYTMPINFQMGGSWLIIFNVERPGKDTIKVDAGLEVIDPNATPTPEVELEE
ncbi:MAG TPA: CopD family protein [Chloroflexia bacterium]|nr:CopD family protein [Chloroflexia bacterium]